MHIKPFLLPIFLCFIHAIGAQTTVSRVTFPIDEQQTTADLAKAGIDLSHGHGKLGSFFTTEALDYELATFDQMGIRYTIDIPDLSKHRKEENLISRGGGLLECQEDFNDEDVPTNFELGNIGGFFSLPDILDQLDLMNYYYPNLISVRKPIGNLKTWENNSIYWVRISDHPETDEDEPEVLYTGLLHARELISVSQNIFYMWYLLENYEKDPMVKQILDHTELYFVPVANPDGLNYNVQGYDQIEKKFNSFQRKNLRDNDGDGKFDPKYDGVDLNRNFGAFWGYDDVGSSPNESAQTYRGPSPFSEPETQAIRDLCNAHDFKLALNYHSYGNL
ncbi:MAG TPA: M14 family metallopeptidase, partial [Saprospiraceae bacterium]|nr:M14 family metallopeptidase [Saprospiraceae bacterium]